jgi:hypothetical protein
VNQLPLFAVPTDKQRRAIAVLQACPGLEPLEFAKRMWPQSEGWARNARFYWSMERVALGMLGQLRGAGYAFVLGLQWHAAVNVPRITLEPSPAEPETPF